MKIEGLEERRAIRRAERFIPPMNPTIKRKWKVLNELSKLSLSQLKAIQAASQQAFNKTKP